MKKIHFLRKFFVRNGPNAFHIQAVEPVQPVHSRELDTSESGHHLQLRLHLSEQSQVHEPKIEMQQKMNRLQRDHMRKQQLEREKDENERQRREQEKLEHERKLLEERERQIQQQQLEKQLMQRLERQYKLRMQDKNDNEAMKTEYSSIEELPQYLLQFPSVLREGVEPESNIRSIIITQSTPIENGQNEVDYTQVENAIVVPKDITIDGINGRINVIRGMMNPNSNIVLTTDATSTFADNSAESTAIPKESVEGNAPKGMNEDEIDNEDEDFDNTNDVNILTDNNNEYGNNDDRPQIIQVPDPNRITRVEDPSIWEIIRGINSVDSGMTSTTPASTTPVNLQIPTTLPPVTSTANDVMDSNQNEGQINAMDIQNDFAGVDDIETVPNSDDTTINEQRETDNSTELIDCMDTHTSCCHWARMNECEMSPVFMLQYCPRSCGKCQQPSSCVVNDDGNGDDNSDDDNNESQNADEDTLIEEITMESNDGLKTDEQPEITEEQNNESSDTSTADQSETGNEENHVEQTEESKTNEPTEVSDTNEDSDEENGSLNENDELCEDQNMNCAGWAGMGECESSPQYMMQFCKMSCGVCRVNDNKNTQVTSETISTISPVTMYVPSVVTTASLATTIAPAQTSTPGVTSTGSIENATTLSAEIITNNDASTTTTHTSIDPSSSGNENDISGSGECRDDNDNCPAWAKAGECSLHSAFMLHFCKVSCGMCDDTEEAQNEITEMPIAEVLQMTEFTPTTIVPSTPTTTTTTTVTPTTSTAVQTTIHDLTTQAMVQPTQNNEQISTTQHLRPVEENNRDNESESTDIIDAIIASSCMDENINCPTWAMAGECSLHPAFMKHFCKRSCRECSDSNEETTEIPQVPPTTLSPVTEATSTTTTIAQTIAPEQSTSNDETTTLIQPTTTVSNVEENPNEISNTINQSDTADITDAINMSTCMDENTNCPAWALAGECSLHPAFMKHFCRKSCAECTEKNEQHNEIPEIPSNVSTSPADLSSTTTTTTTTTTIAQAGQFSLLSMHVVSESD